MYHVIKRQLICSYQLFTTCKFTVFFVFYQYDNCEITKIISIFAGIKFSLKTMYQISIGLDETGNERQTEHFKRYLTSRRLDELESLEINRKPAELGEMGLGEWRNSLTAGIQKFSARFFQMIGEYSFNFHINIQIEIGRAKVAFTPQAVQPNVYELLLQAVQQHADGTKNVVIVVGNNNIVLQDITSSEITINESSIKG